MERGYGITAVAPFLVFMVFNKKQKLAMESIGYYIFCIIAVIIGFLMIKKITGCMIKTLIAFVVAALLAAVYFLYIK